MADILCLAPERGLKKRDTVRIKHERPRGILNIRRTESAHDLARYWPSGDLAPFVEHYWILRWDLREPRVAETVPHPSIHIVLGPQDADVVGIMRRKFSRLLEGRRRVVGTKVRPGAFRPFLTHSVAALTADQAHFIRDFKRLVGRSPADYARRLPPLVDERA